VGAFCAISRFVSYCHQENLLPNADPIANTVFIANGVADADVERDGDAKRIADADSVAVPSVTATQTTTGFPIEIVIDNTYVSNPMFDAAIPPRTISPDMWYGVSFFMPESDPVCGPGSYALRSVYHPPCSQRHAARRGAANDSPLVPCGSRLGSAVDEPSVCCAPVLSDFEQRDCDSELCDHLAPSDLG